jgi:hypothetical protein
MVGTSAGAFAQANFLSGDAIRRAVSAVTLDGVYPGGKFWTETYLPDGNIDYRESGKAMKGRWSVTGAVFCTFYNDETEGGCWRVRAQGSNCLLFYATARPQGGQSRAGPIDKNWGAMGWRQGVTSTCEGRPTV